jgi:hypothetical protein
MEDSTMSENKKMTSDMEMENIAAGSNTVDEIHNLNNFTYRTVVNLPIGTYLQMQATPNGPFMSQMYNNGESIFVNKFFSEAGYLLAFRNGIYGFVDARYVS